MDTFSRRNFLARAAGLAGAALAGQSHSFERTAIAGQTTQVGAGGFFAVARRRGRWWLISPEGEQFFSIGLNHIDSATLRYKENGHIWRDKYGNSMEKWLAQVREDMPQCVGFHLCGAYLVNRVRRRGLRNERDKIQPEAIDRFTQVNRETARWMRR